MKSSEWNLTELADEKNTCGARKGCKRERE